MNAIVPAGPLKSTTVSGEISAMADETAASDAPAATRHPPTPTAAPAPTTTRPTCAADEPAAAVARPARTADEPAAATGKPSAIVCAPLAAAPVQFRFQIAEHSLLTIKRRLVRFIYDLGTLSTDADPDLAAAEANADGFVFQSIPVSKLGLLEQQAGAYLLYIRATFPRHFARLDTSFDAYLASFSGKSRSALKRKMRRFVELSGGRLDLREYRTPDDMEVFHALARQVSRLTYQERLLDAGLPDTAEYRAQMATLAASDRARGYLLFLDGRPVSYLYTPIRDGCAIYAYLGYDPALAQHSPGTVLQLGAMERLFAERRYRYFDFTSGDGQHKRQFATGQYDCADAMLLRRTLGNRALIAAHAGFQRAVAHASAAADRVGIKAKIKRLLRR